MIGKILSLILPDVTKVIDKMIPDKDRAQEINRELQLALLTKDSDDIKARLSAIIAEAQSADPYTSRARPSMLYCWYVLLLSCIPMGILAAISPETATAVADGAQAWLTAIPDSIVDMATFVLCGYIGGRSFEKVKGGK